MWIITRLFQIKFMYKVSKIIIQIFTKFLNLGLENLWVSNLFSSLFTVIMINKIKIKISKCFKI